MASSFRTLRDFLRTRMGMSHIYQPVMIKELLQCGGESLIQIAPRQIGRGFDIDAVQMQAKSAMVFLTGVCRQCKGGR